MPNSGKGILFYLWPGFTVPPTPKALKGEFLINSNLEACEERVSSLLPLILPIGVIEGLPSLLEGRWRQGGVHPN